VDQELVVCQVWEVSQEVEWEELVLELEVLLMLELKTLTEQFYIIDNIPL
jgi:hypothetical protein